MSLAAFLLCAGYGQRLRPLTERVAKPALPFLGRSALEINKRRIETLQPQRWLINTHHLPEQMNAIAGRLGLETLHEPDILGTGGCIANAASVLKHCDHFLVHNADLIHAIDLDALLESHLSSGALATLAGVHHSHHDTLCAAADGALQGVHGYKNFTAPAASARFTFAGIAFYRREFLRFASPGYEDVKHYWALALEAGSGIRVVDCSASAWHDFGTPQGLWDAARFMMDTTGEFSHNYTSIPGDPPYVSNESGQQDLPGDLRNVLIHENGTEPVPAGTRDCILGRGFSWGVKA